MKMRLLKSTVPLLLLLPSCFSNFTEAIPCDSRDECPSGFDCDLSINQCVVSGVAPSPEPIPDGGVSDAGTDLGNTDVGAGPETGFVEDVQEIGDGPCPGGMAHVDNAPGVTAFCVDRFEASRADATDVSAGTNSTGAVSQGNVLPWTSIDAAGARSACEASSKRLCTVDEWTAACGGPDGRAYPYSAIQYVVGMCNTSGSVEPTASRPDCVLEEYLTHDMSGNVVEIVDTGMGGLSLKGGAFGNTAPTALTCNGEPITQAPIDQIGFRCCLSL